MTTTVAAKDFTSTFYSTEEITGISTNANDDFTGTKSYTEEPTTANGPSLITPVIGTTDQLIIFSSVIVGVLGCFVILGIVGWLADEFGAFGDGMYEGIRKICNKKRTNSKTVLGPFPQATLRETTDPDLPSWIRTQQSSRRHDIDGNSVYETVGEASIENQYITPNSHVNKQFHHDDEFSEDEHEEYIEPETTPTGNNNLKPSEIAARERKKNQPGKKQGEAQNAYETEIPGQRGDYETPVASPGSPAYQLGIPGGNEEEYGGSLYSNSSMIPPVIPPRAAK